MFRSVGVQVVTYHNEPEQLTRLAEAIAATMAEARLAGVEHVSVQFGDCGDPASIESFQSDQRKAFSGMCLLIVRSQRGQAGRIRIAASSGGLEAARTEVVSK